ncbi:MAG TPA: polysaccharide biosynthesis tyrosine autokinase [Gemmatimonadaceae bacterium]|nr:polysaccharide biosynthesis tyrosine autokinase [Gemmatimonadaceae bacterium]
MSVRLQPPASPFTPAAAPMPYNAMPPYGIPNPEPESEGIPWSRYIDVLKRHILLIVAIVVAGTAIGIYASKRVRPTFETQLTIWVNSGSIQQSGPIKAGQLVPQTSWPDLLRSFAIVDSVVNTLRLNVFYQQRGDSALLASLQTMPNLRPGTYFLAVDSAGGTYALKTGKHHDVILERGHVGDSIGRSVGVHWVPDPRLLRPGRTVLFSVTTARAMSLNLLGHLKVSLPEDGQFMTITLSGTDPRRIAQTLNEWATQFVTSSTDLKKRNTVEFKNILGDQLGTAESELHNAEIQLEQFRVNTITLPSGTAPVAGGVQATRDPVITNYFQKKESLDEIRSDRVALERMIAESKGGPLNTQAFLLLPSILNNAPQLRTAIEELSTRQASLRTEQQYLTDANPRIKQLNEAVRVLQYETIPQITQSVLVSLRTRETELTNRIDSESAELRQIPTRSIEEMRLVRQVAASENLYNSLKARYEEVSLAEAQTTPDVSVLDYAVSPTRPNSNDAPRLVILAFLASVAVGVALSLLHDRLDRVFRYPEEASRDLGLTIAGTVPQLKASRRGTLQLETMSQAVESFRTLRLAIRYDFPEDQPVVFSVTSPGPGDGKSLVSANLALTFASAGHRTLLVDGDVRRGNQHVTFGAPATPGLVDYLQGTATADRIVKPTPTENLFVIPCGTRRNRAPELLISERMMELIQGLRAQFDCVIIDSPPFIAGVDAYALGAVSGSMVVVLRPTVSDRKLAAAKLEVLDRLPVRLLGAVLNGVPSGGLYKYYATDYSYGDKSPKEPIGNLATPTGLVLKA